MAPVSNGPAFWTETLILPPWFDDMRFTFTVVVFKNQTPV